MIFIKAQNLKFSQSEHSNRRVKPPHILVQGNPTHSIALSANKLKHPFS